MTVFGTYSRYYNLLYRDKDYVGEAEHVHRLIQRHFSGARTILDLGCGTGRHDLLLAEKGYGMTGIDMSEEMLAVAKKRIEIKTEIESNAQSKSQSILNPVFEKGDIRTVRLERTFDVVISLFHVMSYQTTNDDLAAAFATVRGHPKPGGIFIFDCCTDRLCCLIVLQCGSKREDEAITVTRIAEPVMHPNENVVDVNYHVFVRDKANGEVEELEETHRMRYLFSPEIDLFLKGAGMKVVEASEWMTAKAPGFDTWGVCFVVRNKKD